MPKRNSAGGEPSPDRAAAVLARCDLAQACSAETRAGILHAARIEHHPNRAQIHRRGQPMADMALVLDGVLEVSHTSATGRRHVNAYLAPGAVFGLEPMIDGGSCTHDSWARGALTLMHIPRETLQQCMADDPVLRQAVMLELCEQARRAQTQLAQRALLPLRALTAWTLQQIADRHGFHRDHGRRLNLRLPQDGLADLLGVTRQSTNRELKQLEREGLIRVGVSEIELLDMPALQRVASQRL